jgi:hypothetical protein
VRVDRGDKLWFRSSVSKHGIQDDCIGQAPKIQFQKNCKLDLVRVQEVDWDIGGMETEREYTFSTEKELES